MLLKDDLRNSREECALMVRRLPLQVIVAGKRKGTKGPGRPVNRRTARNAHRRFSNALPDHFKPGTPAQRTRHSRQKRLGQEHLVKPKSEKTSPVFTGGSNRVQRHKNDPAARNRSCGIRRTGDRHLVDPGGASRARGIVRGLTFLGTGCGPIKEQR